LNLLIKVELDPDPSLIDQNESRYPLWSALKEMLNFEVSQLPKASF